ncbi:S1 family peptidase [Rhizobium ruizarguesonis]|uniref:S1 family peptidase n=1 Tax=Rhizobium ruizarguesonis TaxID=2081791 RepID=UPI0010386174|nr:trypsin-like serine protease [Rhizobium ruizarguesonis]TBB32450.1 trypsin-like serine protease [Rhizobium ruizarguesonis]
MNRKPWSAKLLFCFCALVFCALALVYPFPYFVHNAATVVTSSGDLSRYSVVVDRAPPAPGKVIATSETQHRQPQSRDGSVTLTSLNAHDTNQPALQQQLQWGNITPNQMWFEQEMRRYTAGIRRAFVSPANNDGILLTTTSFPSAGRLLRRPKGGGDISSCSGALIRSRYFVTAAHCFCERGNTHWPNFKSCVDAGAPDKSDSIVSFPTSGTFFEVAKVTLNPNYTAIDRTKPSDLLADIAVVELSEDIPLPVLALGISKEDDTKAAVGFGVLDLANQAITTIGIPGGPYSSGVEAVFFPIMQACKSKLSQSDVLCANYSSFNIDMGSATCGGDSGGALFGISKTGRATLIGIASSRISMRNQSECMADDAVISVFTDVGKYREWIEDQLGDRASTSARNRLEACSETVAKLDRDGGAVSIPATSTAAYVSIIGAGFYGKDQQPSLLESPPAYCTHPFDHPGLLSCPLPPKSQITILANGAGILQITTCHQLTYWGPK